jgi:hypothetical protein
MSNKAKRTIIGLVMAAIGIVVLLYNKSRVAVGAINYDLSHVIVIVALFLIVAGLAVALMALVKSQKPSTE